MRNRARTESRTNRAQTVIDFGVGAGVFIIAVGIVFAFVPTLFEPFATAAGSSPVVVDRTANHLTGSLLAADPATPSVLSAACTAAFFNETDISDADCGFDASEPTDELLGVDERINVTVRNLSDSPTTGPPVDGERINSVDWTDYTLTRGASNPASEVTVASRVVMIEGDQYRLVVKVW